ncbi:MAG: hypothetical protein A4S12_04630 [Proteobacteria bacterium SG_bin5]|nr:MAG: hypothetical protein A4S12_04630 [Proteobacteria bacterium SG_bin5]
MARTRLTFDVSEEVAELLNELADEASTTKADIIRRGLAVMKVAREQKRHGRPHMGFVEESKKLDAEVVGLLP